MAIRNTIFVMVACNKIFYRPIDLLAIEEREYFYDFRLAMNCAPICIETQSLNGLYLAKAKT